VGRRSKGEKREGRDKRLSGGEKGHYRFI